MGGKYAIPYQVNFMGLFDTVASVGLPDSTRATLDVGLFAGHEAFAGNGAMDIPPQVRFCRHAFSIHEQRMSFPLDSIRKGKSYPGGVREEVPYPGVHSDVGGGYGSANRARVEALIVWTTATSSARSRCTTCTSPRSSLACR